jgi:hypothetical protein
MKSYYRGVEFSVDCSNQFFSNDAEWTWLFFPRREPAAAPVRGSLKGSITDALRACFMAIDESCLRR